ncbi:MAG: gliding motility-associated C-terminal domain-containing protein [Saprospirales bacterium]|nr:gliding motility-associated C-terminal domain-containing protein [Saprospirales bacterium]
MRKFTPLYRLLIFGVAFFTIHSSLFTQNTPCAAVSLPNNMPAFQTYSTAGLTNSGVPYPGCGGNVTVDIWFSVVAPPSGDMDIALKSGTMVNMAMAFYKGPCNNLMLIDCTTDDNCGNPLVPAMQYDNLIPGTTYFIRIWPEGPGGNFQIRVTNGNPPQTPLNFTPVGSAQNTGPYCIQLTAPVGNQTGCGWDPTPVNFSLPFTRQIVYNFGTLDANGADGICMVFQNSPAGIGACGTGGGGLAVQGITNSLIIEFDTWDNGAAFSDIPQDHVAVNVNGVLMAIAGPVPLAGGNIEDGQDHLIFFSWTPATNTFAIQFDGIPVLNGSYPVIANCFGGNPNAYYGVTASTGGSVNLQTACTPEPEIFPAGSEDTTYAQICQGETYFAGGNFQSNTGIYFDNYNSFNGCDSTIITYLTVYPNSFYAFNATVCQGGSVSVGNMTYNTTGVHTTILTNWRGCDSTVVLNLAVLNPQAVIQSSGNITCDNPVVTLNGTGSSTGPGMTFQWTGPSPACITPSPTSPVIQVSCPGVYTLTIKHQVGNVMCSSTTSITVSLNVQVITVDIEAPDTLTCSVNCIALDATGSSNGPGYTYTWAGPGNFVSNLVSPQVCNPGAYSLTVENPANGCQTTGGTVVVENATNPLANAGADAVLSCTQPLQILDGGNSSGSNNLQYVWSDATPTPIDTGQTTPVSAPGSYILLVVDTLNNCFDLDTVLVTQNLNTPVSNAGPSQTVDCTSSSVTLDGSSSSAGPNIGYLWQDGNGAPLGTGTLQTVGDAGTYLLIVTNTISGCSDTSTVDVFQDLNAPVSDPGPDQTLTCGSPTLTLDGSGSSSGPDYSYEWQDAGGAPLGSNPTLPVSEPGAYFLLVTSSANNCIDTAQVLVDIDTIAPTIFAGPDAALTCSDPVVTIGDVLTPPVSGWQYEWLDEDGVTLGNDPLQDVNQPGIYILVITDQSNGCQGQDSVAVGTDDDLPVADAGPPVTLNCVVSLADLGGANSSAGPTIAYSWTDAGGTEISTDPTTTTTIPGIFTLSVLNTDNGCLSTDQITIALDTLAPSADAGPAALLNCFTPDAVLDGSGSSQGFGITYEWSLGGLVLGSNLSLPVSDIGTYTLTVFNGQNGCLESDVVQVTEDFALPTSDAGADLIIDCATNSVTLDGSGSSQGPNITFGWSLGGLVVGGGLSLPVSEAGDYALQVTDTNNGCVSIDSATVALDANAPIADAGPAALLNCFAPDAVLDGSGSSQGPGIVYEWSLGGLVLGAGLSLPVSAPGAYTLSVTNLGNGCLSSNTVQVAIDTISPAADAGLGGTINCVVPQIALGGRGRARDRSFDYDWLLGGSWLGQILTCRFPFRGNYTLIVTNNQNGCSTTSAVTVLEDLAVPTALAGADISLNCNNPDDALDAAGSSQGPEFTYEWLLGGLVVGSGLSLPVTGAGDYTLLVTNTINGCESSDQVLVLADFAEPVANPGASVLLNCAQPSSALDGTGSSQGPEFNYEWLLGGLVVGGGISLIVDDPGIYTLIVTNTQNGCEASASVAVQADFVPPFASAGFDVLLNCYNPTGTLLGTGSSIGPEYAYEWLLGGVVVGGGLSLPVSNVGDYTLTVTNTQNGCEASDQVSVAEDFQTPVAMAGTDLTIDCIQPSVTLNGNGSSSGPEISYEWSLGGLVVGAGISLNVDDPGNYTLTVLNTDNGCSATDEALVGINQNFPQALLSAGGILTCVETEVTLLATGTSTGAVYSYDWNTLTGGTIDLGPGPLDASVTALGTYQLIVLNTQNGCADTAVVQVLQDIEAPVADAGPAAQLNCFLTSFALNGGGSQPAGQLSFAWTTADGALGGNPNSANPTAQTAGTYNLLVTNLQNGCTDSDQVTITATVLENLEVSFTTPGCNGDPAQISIDNVEGGSLPYQYSVDGGTTFSALTLFTDLTAGGYLVVVQDADGCKLEETIFISAPPAVTVDVVPQVTLTLGQSFQLEAFTNIPPANIGSVIWTPAEGLSCSDCLSPVAAPLQSTTYTVTVSDLTGCSAQAVVEVLIEKPTIFVPNTFSPNFDGINDEFLIYSAPGALREIRQMRIFDRWGGKMFEAFSIQPNDIHAGWNGTSRGKIVDVGVFAWMAEVVWADGSVEWIKGDVTVVR